MSSHLAQGDAAPAVAIVGSGPSGCYTAQSLKKLMPHADITIFEALPVPYGLVRYGIAADHQGTKAVSKQFDRSFERSTATFVGNTCVGVDVSFASMQASFDIVVLATGLPDDRPLQVPIADGARVLGAGAMIRDLNSYPTDHQTALPASNVDVGRDVVVIGNGNVALDIVRLLCKGPENLVGSDVNDSALKMLRPEPLRSISILGRSPATNAKFDLAMLRELCQLNTIQVHAVGLPETPTDPITELLLAQRTTEQPVDDARAGVNFHFELNPTEIRSQSGQTIVEAASSSGTKHTFRADSVITAIGFCQLETDRPGAPTSRWDGPNVYRVGWLAGGSGNMAVNRRNAQGVARQIVADLATRTSCPPPGAARALLAGLSSDVVSFPGWQAIDDAERAAADDFRCRRKITDPHEMLAISRDGTRSRPRKLISA